MCFNMLIAAAKVFWPETAAALDVRVRSLDTGGLLQSTTVVQLRCKQPKNCTGNVVSRTHPGKQTSEPAYWIKI